MNFFDMFKTAPAPNPSNDANATVVQPAGTVVPGAGLSDPNKNVDKQPEGTPVNPLDAYKKMYDDSVKSSDISAPTFKLDPAVLTKVSGEMDFTKDINPELMTKALGGDARSLLDVIQTVGRNSYRASLEHTTSLTDAHLNNRAAFDKQSVDKGVKDQLTQHALSNAPNYDHPVVKAELNRIASAYAKANPDARPEQVATAAQKYMQDLQSALAPQKTAAEQTASGEMDWSKYIS